MSREPSDTSSRDGTLFIWLVLGGVIVFAAAVTTGLVLDAEPGSLPEWIEGVSTFAALLAATYAAVLAARSFRLEGEAAVDRRGREERAEQADLVAAWPHLIRSSDVQVPAGTPTSVRTFVIQTGSGWGSMIVNRSELPVYDVTVELFGPDGAPRHTESRATLAPGELFMRWPEGAIRFIVPEAEVDDDWEPGLDESDNNGGYTFGVAISFRDTGGREWQRDRHGQLTLVRRTHFVDASDTIRIGQIRAGDVSPTPGAPSEPLPDNLG